jgi:Domain of unknown function (DUF4288)
MNWYLAKIIYRIICGEGNHTPQFDEQLRLVEACNEEQAWSKALSIGESEEVVFINEQQRQVQWKFVNIAELYRISNFMNGAELYSRIEEPENAEIYIALINRKAENIRNNLSRKVLDIL